MKTWKKVLALMLCVAMLFSALQLATLAEAGDQQVIETLPISTLSDVHIFPDSEQGNRSDAWLRACRLEAKMFNESETIIKTALETACKRAEKNGTKYILVSGDLTKDSEYASHARLAEMLLDCENRYDVEFLVTDGNHDINTTAASTYRNDKKEPARALTYKEFPVVYAELGYDLLAESTDELNALYDPDILVPTPEGEENKGKPGSLSYVADLGDKFRLIVVDSCKYSFNEPVKEQTDGMITEELMQWIEAWAAKTYDDGRTPFMMIHHSLAAHMEVEPSITHAFVLDDYMEAAERIARAGIHYSFSGHLHINDVACVIGDDGEALYDVQTDSVIGYPNTYRESKIEVLKNGETRLSTTAVDFDDVEKMTFDGVTYDNNTYKNQSFALCFGGGLSKDGKPDGTAFLMGMIKAFGSGFLNNINEAGGIMEFLKTMNLDLEEILSGFLGKYIGNGIVVAGHKVFTMDNIMWFIEDLLGQIDNKFLKNLDNLYDVLEPAVEKLMAFQVSEVPCTKFMDTLGFGSKDKPGTLNDLVLSAMAYWYNGNEDASDDAFLLDAIDGFDNGSTFSDLFYFLVNLVLDDLVDGAILPQLEIRLGKLLGDKFLMKQAGDGINYLVKKLLRGDNSYANLFKIVFALEILPYRSLYDILDKVLFVKYLTPSLLDGIGQFVAYVLNDFTSDENPRKLGDSGERAVYSSEKAEVIATQKNYRLPTMVSVTMGDDSKTQATISWFSKFSLPQTDIEIYKSDSEPGFTGRPTTAAAFKIETEGELVERQFPGIDLDFFGILWYVFKLNRHTVKLSGLEPGATYYYRVGNAAHNWWSATGKVRTADGSNNVTFIHLSDQQSQTERQYGEAWGKILKSAFETYPDADFIANAGDLVDHGNNNNQWQGMFDVGAPYLLKTFLMPATGNHEGFGNNATVNYFVLPNVPEQDLESGVYYSFDYNNVHFSVLNSESLNENKGLTDEQIQWIREDVKNSSDATWHFAMLHKAPYSHGSHYKDADVCSIREQLSVLMPELGVDMVFEGHDHVYMRTASLVNNQKVATDYVYLEKDEDLYKTQVLPSGTTYVISGTAGVKYYQANDTSKTDKYFPRAEKMLSLDTPMYSAVEIKDQVLYLSAYTVKDGETIKVDSVAIQKDKSQGNQVEYTEEVQDEERTNGFITFMKTLYSYAVKIFKVIWNLFKIYVLRVKL